MRPSLIAVDLDGTFLADDKSIPELNRIAAAKAAALGIPLVVATGRPPRWLDAISELTELHPVLVTSNGAAIYDRVAGRLVSTYCLDSQSVLQIVEDIREAIPGIRFGVENSFNFGCEPGSPIEQFDDWGAWSGTLPEIIAACQPIIKVLGFHAEWDSDYLIQVAAPAVGNKMTLTHASLGEPFGLLELTAAGVTKATGLAEVCGMLGISAEEVAVFGDMPNDLDMLNWAGMPFIMENSHPDLLAAGLPLVGNNSEGSVGKTILDLLS